MQDVNESYREPPPKRPNPYAWTAPEHVAVAMTMERRHGELIIREHSIFSYSRKNPPAWLIGPVRLRR